VKVFLIDQHDLSVAESRCCIASFALRMAGMVEQNCLPAAQSGCFFSVQARPSISVRGECPAVYDAQQSSMMAACRIDDCR